MADAPPTREGMARVMVLRNDLVKFLVKRLRREPEAAVAAHALMEITLNFFMSHYGPMLTRQLVMRALDEVTENKVS